MICSAAADRQSISYVDSSTGIFAVVRNGDYLFPRIPVLVGPPKWARPPVIAIYVYFPTLDPMMMISLLPHVVAPSYPPI